MIALFVSVICAVTVGGVKTAEHNSTREARYNRNDKPMLLLRPPMGPSGLHQSEKVLISRQFIGPPQHAPMHPFSTMHLHPGHSADILIKRHPMTMQGPPPSFVMSSHPSQNGPVQHHAYQSKSSPPPNRPHHQQVQQFSQAPLPQQQLARQQQPPQGPSSSSSSSSPKSQYRPHPNNPQHPPQQSQPQQQHRKPSGHTIQTQASSKQTIRHKSQPSSSSNFRIVHAAKPTELHSSQKEFRASQPIPSFDSSHLFATDDHLYRNDAAAGVSPSSLASANQFSAFSSAENYLSDFSGGENSWQPAVASAVYPQHTDSAEILQYQTQERISFYPDAHPEYFQSTAGVKTTPAPKRKKVGSSQLRRRVPTTTTTSTPVTSLRYSDESGDRNERPNVRPIYEYQLDEAQPSKRYDDDDIVNGNGGGAAGSAPEGNAYQSVSVSSSLLTTGGADVQQDDDVAGSPALFITPAKPDISDDVLYERAATSTLPTPTTAVAAVHQQRQRPVRKHNNRVFRRKFVPPPAGDSDTCIGSCLNTIVSRVNDPVCGSDERTYENVGRLRCTKLCGDQHLHVAHFGNCESSNNSIN